MKSFDFAGYVLAPGKAVCSTKNARLRAWYFSYVSKAAIDWELDGAFGYLVCNLEKIVVGFRGVFNFKIDRLPFDPFTPFILWEL